MRSVHMGAVPMLAIEEAARLDGAGIGANEGGVKG